MISVLSVYKFTGIRIENAGAIGQGLQGLFESGLAL